MRKPFFYLYFAHLVKEIFCSNALNQSNAMQTPGLDLCERQLNFFDSALLERKEWAIRREKMISVGSPNIFISKSSLSF